jgi:hypothetical protein
MKLRTEPALTAGIQETTMRNALSKFFLSSVLMLSVPLVAGSCIQPVDPNATKDVAGATTRPENFTPKTTIDPTDRPIQLAPENEDMVTADPCEKTKADKDEILRVYCAGCHQSPGSSGQPLFDFILDDTRLLTATIPRDGAPPQPFISPGNPAQSLLYVRVAARSMPPQSMMIGVAGSPSPTLSDISVLADWITNCVPGGSTNPAGGTGGTSGTGGAPGTGGVSGTGGNRGTGGSPVTPDAGTAATGGSNGSDAGAPGTGGSAPADGGTDAGGGGVACANNVANGAVCTPQPPCRTTANLTCNCVAMGGQRRWACR